MNDNAHKNQDPLVSVCCITYNHESFIRDAIEGFLSQKTDFPFEIIIHDDASTDKTADIIREYELKYPGIIKPIYQTQNQYSRGENVILITFGVARGKYIAICEGDDYWIDPLKLQKQISEMEKKPECNICFHSSIIKRINESGREELFGLYSGRTLFSIDEVILGGASFMHTGSIVLNRLALPRIFSYFSTVGYSPIIDYYLQILGSEKGGAIYMEDGMSVYRFRIPGSWSDKFNQDSNYKCSCINDIIRCNEKMDAFTKYRYSNSFTIVNQKIYSDLIKSISIDIGTKEIIIDQSTNKINIWDLLLWRLFFKHRLFINIIRKLKYNNKQPMGHKE